MARWVRYESETHGVTSSARLAVLTRKIREKYIINIGRRPEADPRGTPAKAVNSFEMQAAAFIVRFGWQENISAVSAQNMNTASVPRVSEKSTTTAGKVQSILCTLTGLLVRISMCKIYRL